MVDEEQNWSTIAEQLKCSEDECGTVYDSLFAKQTRKRACTFSVFNSIYGFSSVITWF